MPASKRAARSIGYTKAAYQEAARARRAHANRNKALVSRSYFKDPGDQVFLGATTRLVRGDRGS